ncbi:hypothetical protein [Streptomyces noursei]|uniref:hypothetical protein n=1 Tax=Streptomyces noursei TaxID=1971 RepID=UPI0023B7AD30|nr:hypothetical protein [Streptomyces noursei]
MTLNIPPYPSHAPGDEPHHPTGARVEQVLAAAKNAADWYNGKHLCEQRRFDWRKVHPVYNGACLLVAWNVNLPFLWTPFASLAQGMASLTHPMSASAFVLPTYGDHPIPLAIQAPLILNSIWNNPGGALVGGVAVCMALGGIAAVFNAFAMRRLRRAIERQTLVLAVEEARKAFVERHRNPGAARRIWRFALHTALWGAGTGIWMFRPLTEAFFGPIWSGQ